VEKMKLKEFIEKYCADIMAEAAKQKALVPEIEFTYDTIIKDEEGYPVKVIEVEGFYVDITDILSLSENDFVQKYPQEAAIEAYRRYLENFIIIEGEEVLEMVRRRVASSQDKIAAYKDLNLEELI